MAKTLLESDLLRRLERLELQPRRVLGGQFRGERRSRKRGIGIDFADYRQYTRGDDLRFIDWNIYGRLDRLFIKLYQEEQDLQVHSDVHAQELKNLESQRDSLRTQLSDATMAAQTYEKRYNDRPLHSSQQLRHSGEFRPGKVYGDGRCQYFRFIQMPGRQFEVSVFFFIR